jgi:hypothetical protein
VQSLNYIFLLSSAFSTNFKLSPEIPRFLELLFVLTLFFQIKFPKIFLQQPVVFVIFLNYSLIIFYLLLKFIVCMLKWVLKSTHLYPYVCFVKYNTTIERHFRKNSLIKIASLCSNTFRFTTSYSRFTKLTEAWTPQQHRIFILSSSFLRWRIKRQHQIQVYSVNL